MPRATIFRFAFALPLLLALAACGDCGGGGGDAGPDGGDVPTDGGGDQCSFIGGDCETTADCCNELVCGTDGVCGEAPSCENNDTFAGTPTAPASLEDLGDNMPLACSGFPFLDVFTIEASAGEILRITLQTEGVAPNTPIAQGESDIDMYLLNGPPTGVTNQNGGNSVQGPIVEAGATELSTEQILYEVPETGTYYLAVTVWSGPDAEYSLDMSRGVGCNFDADCAAPFDYCRVAVDPDALVVIQECATWTAPGCGAGDEEAGGDVHSDADAVALTDTISGLTCGGDIDVFTFEKARTERALVTVTSADLPADDALVGTIVDANGDIFDVFVLESDPGTIDYAVNIGAAAGTYYLYLEQFGTATSGATYDVSVDLQAACRTDADCAGGRTCGQEIFGGGPSLVCVVAEDPCSDADADNSRTTATPLVEGSTESDAVCMGGWDMYAIDLTDAATNVELTLTWTGSADMDLYVYAEDGTGLGAGWYGTNTETWEGIALTAQTLYAWVSVFACDFDAQGAAVPCDDQHSYSLTVTESAPTVCDQDEDCFIGGTTSTANATDPQSNYQCASVVGEPGDTGDAGTAEDGGVSDGDAGASTVQACVRPFEVALFTKQGGEGCYDPFDCEDIACIDSYCTTNCPGGDADCDASLGAGNGYCFELVQNPICLLDCTDDADCDRVWGAENNLSCTAGECVLP